MMNLTQARELAAIINQYVATSIDVTELKATQADHAAIKSKMSSMIALHFLTGAQELAQVINKYTNVSLAVRELKATQAEHAAVKMEMTKLISANVIPDYC